MAPVGALVDVQRQANRRGIRLMVLAMTCFIANDVLVKWVSQSLPAGQLIFVRGLMATALVLAVMRLNAVPLAPRRLARGWVAARAGIDALATLAYLLALFHLPIANATAINMATPLFVTLLAALWLGHRVMPARWAIIAIGFSGVLLVIQPQPEGLNHWAWLCLGSTLLNALRDVVTLRIPRDIPTLGITLATAVTVTLVALALAGLQGWMPMNLPQLACLALAAVFLASAYFFVIQATRAAEPAVVAPFRYSGLLMAVALGWALWGDVPNALAWAGIVLVIGAGLVLLRLGRA